MSRYDPAIVNVNQGCPSTRTGKPSTACPAEFFAVLSEAFFETPRAVQAAYGDVYRQLAAFYRQDPAARLGRRVRSVAQ